MKVQVTELGPCKRLVEIELPADEIKDQLDSIYEEYRRKVKIPGFRPGKAPRSVFRARLGKEIHREAVSRLVPEAYAKARDQGYFEPVSEPVVDQVELQEENGLRFKATVDVKPPIALKDYRGIRAKRRTVKVDDQAIEETLEGLRRRRGELVPVTRPAREGDFLVADVQYLDPSGVAIIGRKVANYEFELGSSRFGRAFDSALVGVESGQERRFTLVSPDRESQRPVGSEEAFAVTVLEVKERHLPELTDEFAMTVSGRDSLEELRRHIAERLEAAPEEEVREEVVDNLVDMNAFPVPESMVERSLDSALAGMDFRTKTPAEAEELRGRLREQAERNVRRYLLIREIAATEKMEVTDEEVEQRLARIAEARDVSPDQVRKEMEDKGALKPIVSELLERKVIDLLVEHADIELVGA